MLEAVGLVVHVVHGDAERLREVELEQPVVPDHLEGHALALGREGDAAVGGVLDEVQGRELLHHRAGGGRRDPHLAGERRRGDPLAGGAEVVDLAQVVLDRVAQPWRPGHRPSLEGS